MSDFYCAYTSRALRLHFAEQAGRLHVKVKPCCIIHDDLAPPEVSWQPYQDLNTITQNSGLSAYHQWFKTKQTFHPSCQTCESNEQSGRLGNREKMNRLVDSQPDFDYHLIDVAMGNHCNLACAFCTQSFSSLIQKMVQNLDGPPPESWAEPAPASANPKQVGSIIAELLERYRVRTLKFVGGEPLLRENWQPVGDIINSGTQPNLCLEITTNGTVMNQSLLDEFSKVDSVMIRFSIDGIGENYELMRYPHPWPRMERNLDFFLQNRPDNVNYRIAILANAMNFEYLPDIERYYQEKGVDFWVNYNIKPNNAVLHWHNLPDSLIDKVQNSLTDQSAQQGLNIQLDRKKRSQEEVSKEIQWFLKHRGRSAERTLGPETRQYLNL
jgi:sulfatase maturation enzyme AslB (radical SAM superfamily)